MHRLILIIAWVLFSTISLLGQSCRDSARTNSDSPSEKVPLESLLLRLAEANKDFFTVEEALVGGVAGHIRDYCVAPPPAARDFSDALHYLAQAVPNFAYEVDSENQNVFHIIDARLTRHEGYALDEVADLNFDGTVTELVGALNAKGIPMSAAGAFDSHEFMFVDRSTEVHVRAKGLAVRSILSDFLPLQGRGRMLWHTETAVGSNQISYVRFRGAPPVK